MSETGSLKREALTINLEEVSESSSNDSNNVASAVSPNRDDPADHSIVNTSMLDYNTSQLITDTPVSPTATATQAVVNASGTPIRNPNRSKLSVKDIRLIMYLIIHIKPFKYIGNRSFSQTKKWELLQDKYFEIRSQETNSENFSVPTIRTLQRQLAGAIKKARARRKKDEEMGVVRSHIIPSTLDAIEKDEYYDYSRIEPDSSLAEMEDAVFDLHEVSEKIKIIKVQNSQSTKQEEENQESYIPASSSSNLANIITSSLATASAPVVASGVTPNLNAEQQAKKTRAKDEAILKQITQLKDNMSVIDEDQTFTKVFKIFEEIVKASNENESLILNENSTFKAQIENLTSEHFKKINNIHETHLSRQHEFNKKLVELIKSKCEDNEKFQSIIGDLASLRDLID
ncbi:uncharacterized protein J8A68_002963 [[Candida] subhashii]|uniref:Uncharacterized protein n=1 Tax=[Candida] subhashii TaxID=561895 RepID=A0A8J5QK84_9ASCO|nr:uncharacterized protein J8A68_002963 [[Candida] subhashii]KAG7663504.1 hypothetical protein J8A68_002963 [[Candida] subhashii]